MRNESPNLRRALIGFASLGVLCLGGIATPAFANEPDATPADAVAALEQELDVQALAGDRDAEESRTQLENLDDDTLNELGEVLTGKSDISPVKPSIDAVETYTEDAILLTDGYAEWGFASAESDVFLDDENVGEDQAVSVVHTSSGFSNHPHVSKAAAVARSVWGTQWFKFAGIKLTETKVWGKYSVNRGKITRITDHGCQVVQNIVPGKHVTVTRQSKSFTAATATFTCKVRVERGAIKGMNWSTREGYQLIKANAGGKVTFNGWN